MPKKQKPTNQVAYLNREFMQSKDSRSVRVLAEFLEPGIRLSRYGIENTIVFFGSARAQPPEMANKRLKEAKKSLSPESKQYKRLQKISELSQYYLDAQELAKRLTEWSKSQKHNYTICSGGGPGIMEAANRGAKQANGQSIGLNIQLPMEQNCNHYISDALNLEFHYFFIRKFWFLYHAKAILMFPGGYGTMDEMMEVLTLLQTEKITKKMVLILYGEEFWKKVINFDYLVDSGMIDNNDLKLFSYCNTVNEAFDYITSHIRTFSPAAP